MSGGFNYATRESVRFAHSPHDKRFIPGKSALFGRSDAANLRHLSKGRPLEKSKHQLYRSLAQTLIQLAHKSYRKVQ